MTNLRLTKNGTRLVITVYEWAPGIFLPPKSTGKSPNDMKCVDWIMKIITKYMYRIFYWIKKEMYDMII